MARSIQPKFPEISVKDWMDWFGPTGKVSKKSVHLSNRTTILGWNGPIEMGRSAWPSQSQSQDLAVRYLLCTKWREILITSPLWIVNSGSIGVTRTSMSSKDRSVATSHAKCMFWLLTDLFPEIIWNVLFVIRFERGVWSHTANIWELSAQNNPLYSLIYYDDIIAITVEIII